MTEESEGYSPFKPTPGTGLTGVLRRLAGGVKAWILRGVLDDDGLYHRHIQQFPDRIFMMGTTICNARCTFCPQSTHIDKKMVMEEEVFAKVIAEFGAKGGKRATMNPNNGDPLVDPRFVERARQARAAGVQWLDVSTNGILLGRGDTAVGLAAVMDRVRISLPGLDHDDYLRVYGVDKAEELRDGLEKLARAKKDSGAKLDIVLDLRVDRPLADVLRDDGMVALAPYIDDGTIRIDYGQIYSEMETWSDQVTAEQLPGTMRLRTDIPERPRPCKRMFTDVAVLADGQIRVCACRYRATNYDDMVVGDTKTDTIEAIVFGPAHRRILQRAAAGDWPMVCHGCTLYQPHDYPRTTWVRMAIGRIQGLFH
ncbi:MAG: radical SAM protein [Magnetospirillum sp.]|nr:MAG: radical SAM protein [Magnetospirillum sp.]